MRKRTLLIICFCTAILITALAVLTKRFPNLFSSMMAFPFEQIGCGLGALSKTGFAGNGATAALWVGISLIPFMAALKYEKGRETVPERASLYVLSGTVLLALYGMINPGLFCSALPAGLSEYEKLIRAVFGISVWAVVVLYGILRLIRLFRRGNKEQLLRYMRTVLYALCILFTAAAAIIFANGVTALMDTAHTGADTGFGVFQLITELIPYILDVIIIMRVTDLLGVAGTKQQDGIAESAGRVSSVCCLALGVTTALTALSNILQIVLMRWLTAISVTVNIPIISIAFTVTILLFSRLVIENKKLRDDNSLFI